MTRSLIAIEGTSIILPCFPKKISGTIVLLNSFSNDENILSLTLRVISFDEDLKFGFPIDFETWDLFSFSLKFCSFSVAEVLQLWG
jgi:hypothetical protein